MYTWNDIKLEKKYNSIKEFAKEDCYFTDEELSSPYLDKLSHKTKSTRIYRMIELAYYLGQLRAVKSIDEGETVITLSNEELNDWND